MVVIKPQTIPRQDMPPPGGYPPFDIHMRGHQRPKMNSWVLAGLFFAISGYGIYKIATRNATYHRKNLSDERETRFAIFPYLMVEDDKAWSVKLAERKKWEAEVMKDVPGFIPGENMYARRWIKPYV